jgi:hypothetical protein
MGRWGAGECNVPITTPQHHPNPEQAIRMPALWICWPDLFLKYVLTTYAKVIITNNHSSMMYQLCRILNQFSP